ncbi:MAG: acyl-CoA dehydrogenase family protein [Polyangiaceae bacterium]|nr:acyl-CoA dehydrogenase family protein [Polyangiaceae bacterium]
MTDAAEQGRAALLEWRARQPTNWYTSDPDLALTMRARLGPERYEAERPRLVAAGEMVATRLLPLAELTNQDENLPRLERWSGLGQRVEEVVFHPAYHEAGRLIWETGVIADYAEPGRETLQLALFHLFAQGGENGHQCPLACTAGLVKVLRAAGTEDQRARYLPRLLARDYSQRLHASQFLTEVQGGSDVGANSAVARPEGDGFRIHGEKWFCSVIDAGAFLLTARPEGAPGGTRGLGLFLVPRTLEGRPNGFSVRRLKRKLGTRAMASGEADFDGALGELLGPLDRGFKLVVEHVLDTSRLYNAVACAGSARAAWREASSYARHREAFGRAIAEYPLVQETIALLRAEALALTSASLRIAARGDQLALGRPGADDELAHRVAVNVAKYWTAVRSTQCVRSAMEVLGGNATIETFTPLVRLYRDAMVLESWEGAHNVLVQQITRDAARLGAHRPFLAELGEALGRLQLPGAEAEIARVRGGLESLERGFTLLAEVEGEQRLARRVVDQAGVVLALVAMLEELAVDPADAARRGAIQLIADRFLAPELERSRPLPAALLAP